MEKTNDILMADTLGGLERMAGEGYLTHALCVGGSCSFLFNNRKFELHEGDLMIVRKGKLIEKLRPGEDFRVKVVYVTAEFIQLATPQSNYGVRGQLALFLNPVMRLTEAQFVRCLDDFGQLAYRISDTGHHFYRDMLLCAVQTLILDFFDFHSHLYQEADVSTQYASIMTRFINLLESGEYRANREVTYYADRLCVTSKYLSEVSKTASGYAANYWINLYTTLDITRLLRDKSLTFVQISDMFHFSSPSYFTRYVQRQLGVNPTEYRV